MEEVTRDTIVSLAAFAAIFGIAYLFLMTRHRERMGMLERNMEVSPFHSIKNANVSVLKYGMFLVGIAIGILMGNVLINLGIGKTISFLSMTFLFGGISLILNYLIVRKQNP